VRYEDVVKEGEERRRREGRKEGREKEGGRTD